MTLSLSNLGGDHLRRIVSDHLTDDDLLPDFDVLHEIDDCLPRVRLGPDSLR